MSDPTNPTDPTAAPEPDEESVTPEAGGQPVAASATEPVAAEAPDLAEPVAPAVTVTRRPRGPRPYAVVETGGKQYRVSVGDRISVDLLAGTPGSEVTLERVLLLGGDGVPRIGMPVVTGASVSARIDEHFRGDKIVVFTYKPKKRYRRKMGHRQSLTRLEITAINA